MNHTDVRNMQMTDSATEVCVSALSKQFASRGLAKSVVLEANERMEAEEKTRELAPDAYRLSLLSEAAVKGIYKRGKDTMEVSDLLRYAQECRRMHQRTQDEEINESIYGAEVTLPTPVEAAPSGIQSRIRSVSTGVKALPAKTAAVIRERFPLWFDFRASDTSGESKKFPVSAFAAILAIAVSLVLIVASALMITHTETKISKLNSEIATLHSEISDLESKLESSADLMEIRRIAVEEYGMVEEEHLKMEYLSLNSAEDIEVFEQRRSRELGLSAILSAIGWKK